MKDGRPARPTSEINNTFPPVILSEVVVREAGDYAVEGPLACRHSERPEGPVPVLWSSKFPSASIIVQACKGSFDCGAAYAAPPLRKTGSENTGAKMQFRQSRKRAVKRSSTAYSRLGHPVAKRRHSSADRPIDTRRRILGAMGMLRQPCSVVRKIACDGNQPNREQQRPKEATLPLSANDDERSPCQIQHKKDSADWEDGTRPDVRLSSHGM